MQLVSPSEAAGRVTAALKGAAQATGAGFDYLLRTAQRESSLNPSAKASTSSARGLFQFIDQTWLQVLKEDGPSLGLGAEAADVTRTSSGRYTVSDPTRKAELLALRDDPTAAALLAGAFTRRNAATLTSELGRAPTEGELYAAHFLGAQGASDLIKLAATTPNASAADAFPVQAAGNRPIFYERGRERTASEVYAKLTTGGAATATVAQAAPTTASAALSLQQTTDDASYGPFRAENDGKAFHSMFQTGRRSPVAAYVSQSWSSLGAAGLAADASPRAAAPAVAQRAVATAYAATPVQATSVPAVFVSEVRSPEPSAVATAAPAARTRRRAAAAAVASSAAPLDLASFRKAFDATPVGIAARSARK